MVSFFVLVPFFPPALTAGVPAGLLHVRMASKDKDTSTNAPFEVT